MTGPNRFRGLPLKERPICLLFIFRQRRWAQEGRPAIKYAHGQPVASFSHNMMVTAESMVLAEMVATARSVLPCISLAMI